MTALSILLRCDDDDNYYDAATTAVSTAVRAESLGFRGVSSSPVYRTFVSGCEGPRHRGIA